MQIGYRL